VTEKAGLARPDKQYGPLWSVAAAWVDINNDGLLDLFVVNYLSWDGSKEPDCKFNGQPEFCHRSSTRSSRASSSSTTAMAHLPNIGEQAGIRAHREKACRRVLPITTNDGLPDIFITNDKLFNFLYHNKGHIVSRRLDSKWEWLCRSTET